MSWIRHFAIPVLYFVMDDAGGSRMETLLIAAMAAVFCTLLILAVRKAG